ncbi:DUF4282 domain-containing protein [Microbacterium sp. SS28]|uniref:DUF4282 domain-containing protein n=1 Tax=Microbacterium sp. SS28 TaxID=2919948 RepID=UPI001FA9930E|nr:DUF4282 domain-containing protein [Microbacterium sp. SS28]
MSDTTPTPPPLPEQPAGEAAARRSATTPGAAGTGPARTYDPAVDPDDTGVPRAVGDASDIGRGFLSALFDISFRTFITRRLASAFYVVGLIAIGIGFLVWFVRGIVGGIDLLSFNVGAGVSLLVATIILVPIATFLAIVVLRFIIEAVVALIAIAENTQRTADNTRR